MQSKKSESVKWSELRIGIVAARWNPTVTDMLVEGAMETLVSKGIPAESVTVVRCPGSYEIPLTCKWLLEYLKPDGVIAIGAVVRGETPHFDYVCSAVNRGVMELNLTYEKPVSFGVLTTDNHEQALRRANGEHGNKGAEAALAMCDMFTVQHALKERED